MPHRRLEAQAQMFVQMAQSTISGIMLLLTLLVFTLVFRGRWPTMLLATVSYGFLAIVGGGVVNAIAFACWLAACSASA